MKKPDLVFVCLTLAADLIIVTLAGITLFHVREGVPTFFCMVIIGYFTREMVATVRTFLKS